MTRDAPTSGPHHWRSAAFHADVTAWVDDALATAGRTRTGPVEQPRVRPWGTVLRAATSGGDVWVKAPAADVVFEVALYRVLADVVPDAVLTPLAADVRRGLLLLPDGGAPIRDTAGDALVEEFTDALVRHGALQRTLSPHVDRLLAAGVTDMRPAVMPQRFDAAVAALAVDPAVAAPVVDVRRLFVRWCGDLADSVVPPSLDHNDLHDGNVLRPAGRTVFYDWGDSVVAHPFAVLLVALGVLRRLLGGVRAQDPRVVAARSAYLAGFADLAPDEDLDATAEAACRVAKVARALVWERALVGAPEDVPAAWAAGPLAYLSSVTQASYLYEHTGPGDAGPEDAGPEDAGPEDAGPEDAGPEGGPE